MEFPIPQHLKKRNNDYISYTATNAAKEATEVNNICYATHMSMLPTHEFLCLPRRERADWKEYFIDAETYLRFINIFKEHKIVTEATEAWIDGDVPKMKIPLGTSRHRAYAALCAYRWAESCSPLAWQVVKLVDDMPETSVWQILHYVMAVHVTGIGHNWCNVGITDMTYGYTYLNSGQSFNMALSLAFPLFWYKSEEELLAMGADRTCDAVQKIADSIGPTATKGTVKMPLPTVLVNGENKNCDILNTRWNPLYKLASVAAVGQWPAGTLKEEIAGMYGEIVAQHKDIQELREKLENPKRTKAGYYGSYDY